MRVHTMSNDMSQAPVEQPHGRLGLVTVERHIDMTFSLCTVGVHCDKIAVRTISMSMDVRIDSRKSDGFLARRWVTLLIGRLTAVLKSRRRGLHRLRWLDNMWPGS